MAATKQQYANPMAHASVRGERIDMGVDYAGTGTLGAIAHGIVTEVSPGEWGSFGNYVKYQITDKASPLYGLEVYYAEGVNAVVGVGDKLNPGDPVANLIPGWHSGIEVGFAGSGHGTTYAQQHGGWTSQEDAANDWSAAGESFSTLVGDLGGPTGFQEGQMVPGSTAPAGAETLIGEQNKHAQGFLLGLAGAEVAGGAAYGAAAAADAAGVGIGAGGLSKLGSAAKDAAQAAKDAGPLAAIAAFLSNPIPALLTVALVLAGVVLMFAGVGRMLGYGHPVQAAAGKVREAVA